MTGRVLGVRFDAVTLSGAVERALALMAQGRSAYVCTPNPEIVWACRKDTDLLAAIEGADMTLADGVGVVWACRRLGCPVPERVTGYDFFLALLERFSGRVYLLGGVPGVAREAAAVIGQRFPAVQVCGFHDGYFESDGPVLEQIRRAKPDLLAVCLGSPRQELFMARNRQALDGCLMAGLGGSLDVLSGRKRRAPAGWIRLRLEWLYRLIREPGRLGRMMCLPGFVLAVLAQSVKKETGLK